MNGLNQVRDAVIAAIKNAGVAAVPAYEGREKRYDGPVAAVDVAAAEGKPVGLCGYLGEVFDETAGKTREVYGLQMEVTVSVEVRAIAASGCEAAMETAAETLMHGLPAGIKTGAMAWSGLSWDKESAMFLRRGTLTGRAAFIAEDRTETGEFLDFILKGTMKH